MERYLSISMPVCQRNIPIETKMQSHSNDLVPSGHFVGRKKIDLCAFRSVGTCRGIVKL